jgi:hypothetical protein
MSHHEEEFGYDNGKGTWLIVVLVIAILILVIGYGSTYFFPDLTNWIKGGNPDVIQWMREVPKN